MASVTFSSAIGGDGSTVTDDSSPTTGLGGGGHRTRFVPCLTQMVNVTNYAAGRATAAASSASAAAASASGAATSATNASNSATAAANSATSSSNSATASANSAASAAATVASAIAAAFPVGAIYITASNVNPGTFLPGTWTQIAAGRTLIGVGTLGSDTYAAGATGGAARVTLSTSEMPWHNHDGTTGGISSDHTHAGVTATDGLHAHSVKEGSAAIGGTSSEFLTSGDDYTNTIAYYSTTVPGGEHSHVFTTGGSSSNHVHNILGEGGGGAHENRMPYLAVYFWQRTA